MPDKYFEYKYALFFVNEKKIIDNVFIKYIAFTADYFTLIF